MTTMKLPSYFALASLAKLAIAGTALYALTACDTETPTTAVVDDAYPAVDGGDPAQQIVVFKTWWQTTVFLDPVLPGAESQEQRTVPASDYAYALLAPGWDPASAIPPSVLIAVRSNDKLAVARGDTLHIRVSDAAFTGNCAAGKPLAQEDVDFITGSIFPGDFATVTYDAKTCVATPLPIDASVDAGSEGGSDAGDGA
jgi:hypothetical protein